MLESLAVENLAIIESAEVRLKAGLNAITGETGAGKSVLIGALELALGERASADAVRSGAKLATVEATFVPPLPERATRFLTRELELDCEASEPIVVRREVSARGRSRCFIGGQMVNVGDLHRFGELLIDLHGQHEHQSLFRLAAQRSALDAFAGNEKFLSAYRSRYSIHAELASRKQELERKASEFESQADYLEFQIGELEELDLGDGELKELVGEEARLGNAETLSLSAQEAYRVLYEGDETEAGEADPILSQWSEVTRLLDRVAELDSEMASLPERARELQAGMEDLAAEVRDYGARCEADPARLESVIERIESIRRLLRKHHRRDEAGLIQLLGELRNEREALTLEDEERNEIEEKLALARRALEDAADRVTESRGKAARRFAKEVSKTLARVGMEKAKFEVEIRALEEFGLDGRDRVEFLLAANPGEGSNPLREVASGGELSRTMLAIKTALAARDGIPTLVFDEIDAGISGETAARVGELVADLGGEYQILCITHHASIAARATHHLSIRKSIEGRRTRMEAVALGKAERLEELSRMMGGEGSSAAGKRLAKQLLGA